MTPSPETQGQGKRTPAQTEMNMSEGKWTPGPWFCDDVGIIRVGAEVGKYQQPVMHASAWREGAWDNDPTAIANGRLIAAAPELYEALKEAERLYSETKLLANDAGCGAWVGRARAALLKASGGSDV